MCTKMAKTALVLCVIISLTNGAYGAFTWVQPANGDGTCGNVDENTAHGNLGASTDIDVTSDAGHKIDYAIVTQPTGVELSIHGQGSFSIVHGTIDYEAANPPELVVVFTVEDQVPEIATGTCTIAINDLNDNAPVFPANQEVDVDQLVSGTVVSSTFTATDGDGTSPNNQILSYALDGPANAVALFAVNTISGEITLDDLSITCDPAYSLVITAVDGGSEPMTGTGTLSVNMNACVTTTVDPGQVTTTETMETTIVGPAPTTTTEQDQTTSTEADQTTTTEPVDTTTIEPADTTTTEQIQTTTTESDQTTTIEPAETTTTESVETTTIEPAKTTTTESVETTTIEPAETTTTESVETTTIGPAETTTTEQADTTTIGPAETTTTEQADTTTIEQAQTTTTVSDQTTTAEPDQTTSVEPIQTTTVEPDQTTTADQSQTTTADQDQTTTVESAQTTTVESDNVTTAGACSVSHTLLTAFMTFGVICLVCILE